MVAQTRFADSGELRSTLRAVAGRLAEIRTWIDQVAADGLRRAMHNELSATPGIEPGEIEGILKAVFVPFTEVWEDVDRAHHKLMKTADAVDGYEDRIHDARSVSQKDTLTVS